MWWFRQPSPCGCQTNALPPATSFPPCTVNHPESLLGPWFMCVPAIYLRSRVWPIRPSAYPLKQDWRVWLELMSYALGYALAVVYYSKLEIFNTPHAGVCISIDPTHCLAKLATSCITGLWEVVIACWLCHAGASVELLATVRNCRLTTGQRSCKVVANIFPILARFG